MRREFFEEILNEKVVNFVFTTGKFYTDSGKVYFLKVREKSRAILCEANGLNEIFESNTMITPQIISVGENFILTEYIANENPSGDFFYRFGKQLAQMHKVHSDHFGFYENSFIGNNPQLNIPTEQEKKNWCAFYFEKRLLYQYKLAEKNGFVSLSMKNNFLKLETRIENILRGSEEPPTLLHGDLWSGNYLCNKSNIPVLIDPAVYYGHREADLAMTKLFGGFSSSFYQSYMTEYPLKEGWEYRENIYRLYHVLNHLNLFGVGYLSEVESIIADYAQ